MSTLEDMESLREKKYAVGTKFITTDQDIDFLESGGYYTNLLILLREVSEIQITEDLRDLLISGMRVLADTIKSHPLLNTRGDFYEMIGDIIGEYARKLDTNAVTNSLQEAIREYYVNTTSNTLSSSIEGLMNFIENITNELQIHDQTILTLLDIVIQDMEKIHGNQEDAIDQSLILRTMFPDLFNYIYHVTHNEEALSEDPEIQKKFDLEMQSLLSKFVKQINEIFGDEETRTILITPLKTMKTLLQSKDLEQETISSFIDTLGEISKNWILFLTWFSGLEDLILPLFKNRINNSIYSQFGINSNIDISSILSTRNIMMFLFPYINPDLSFKSTLKNHQWIMVDGTSQKPFVTLSKTNKAITVNGIFKNALRILEPSLFEDEDDSSKSKQSITLREASLRRPLIPVWDFDYPILELEDFPLSLIDPKTKYIGLVYLQRFSFYILRILIPPVFCTFLTLIYDISINSKDMQYNLFYPFLSTPEREGFLHKADSTVVTILKTISTFFDIPSDTLVDIRKMSNVLYSPLLNTLHFVKIPLDIIVNHFINNDVPENESNRFKELYRHFSVMGLLYWFL